MTKTLTAKESRPATTALRRPTFGTLRREMEELLSRMWVDHDGAWWSGDFSPSADLAETEQAFEIRVDAPGMAAKDFDIEVNGNIATIRGERKEEKEEKGKTYHRIERRHGSFSRSMTLPCNVNEDEVAAEYTNGILTVTLPKREDAAPKKVSVKG
jgi:HSP20 family protein